MKDGRSKRTVKNYIKLRREIKTNFLKWNIALFLDAKNVSPKGWRYNNSAVEFVEKARKEIGYSCRTFGWDILSSFKRLEEQIGLKLK